MVASRLSSSGQCPHPINRVNGKIHLPSDGVHSIHLFDSVNPRFLARPYSLYNAGRRANQMSQEKVTSHPADDKRASETAQARAELELRAVKQGVRPFDAEEWSDEFATEQTSAEVRQEVDEFLSLLREWRETPSHRSLG
jgi:hypothetical protein